VKIYHLIIAYNDRTEEVEYIQEHIEEELPEGVMPVEMEMELDDEYFDDEELIKLINENGLGEA
tara:strand:- start:6943 stop:7134 length:192 start_codon:yes stop_codon:yes gene_type:complete